jgi:Ca2+-binding EF-hand superfamily protein
MIRTTLSVVAATLLAATALPAFALTADDFPGEAIALIDTDGDGIITGAEIDAFAVAILPAMDANEDGTVTTDELAPILTAEQITTIDTNGDGIISAEELTVVLRADFAAADLDGNGTLN